jgi:hypothetical protein
LFNEFHIDLGPTIDGRVSPQRHLSSSSINDGNAVPTGSEHEVFVDIFTYRKA